MVILSLKLKRVNNSNNNNNNTNNNNNIALSCIFRKERLDEDIKKTPKEEL